MLGSIAGVVSLSLVGTSMTGASQQVEEPDPFDLAPPGQGTDRQFGVSPTSGHCAPTTFDPEWTSDDLGAGINTLSLRIDGGPVYVSGNDVLDPLSDGEIYALDRETGELLDGWPVTPAGFPAVVPLTEDRTLYIALDTTASVLTVGSLDPVTGNEQWRREFSGQAFGYGIGFDQERDTIYLTLNGPTVLALDAGSGSTEWFSEVGSGRVSVGIRFGSTLYAIGTDASGDGLVSSIDIETEGTENWRMTRPTSVGSFPSVGSDVVVFGFSSLREDGDTELVAVEKGSGTERWSIGRDDNLIYAGTSLIDGDAVYTTAGFNQDSSPSSQGVVQRLDVNDGSEVYEVDVGGLVLGLRRDDQRVYVQTRPGDVIGIDDDPSSGGYGSEAWRQSLDGDISDGRLSLVCGTLYTGTNVSPGRMYAIDAETGDELDSYTLDSGAVRTGFAQGGDVWVSSGRPSNSDSDQDFPNRAYRFTGGDQTDTSVTVSGQPDSVEVGVDEETTVDIVIGGADTGIGSYELTATVGDAGTASITDVSLARGPTSGVEIADDGSAATLDVDLSDPFESGDTVVASVTLAGESRGSTTFGFENVTVIGSEGTEQTIEALREAAVTVTEGEGPPPVLEDPPTDLDGDDNYEDLDGDGEFSIGDVSLFFETFRSPVVQDNAEFFDFDGDGEVTLDDVRALFSDYVSESAGAGANAVEIEPEGLSEEQLGAVIDRYEDLL